MAYLATTAEQMAKWAGLPGAATVEELVRDIERGSQQVPRILVNVLNALSRD
jgi:hypothetical protein